VQRVDADDAVGHAIVAVLAFEFGQQFIAERRWFEQPVVPVLRFVRIVRVLIAAIFRRSLRQSGQPRQPRQPE
jgi:cytochrome bd-type quinol oxidase subunit 2